MMGVFPISWGWEGIQGISLGEILKTEVLEKQILSLFLIKNSDFKLGFERHFGILNAIFCFNFSLNWLCVVVLRPR